METTSGAKLSSACKEALASLGIGMLGVVFTAASVATGPMDREHQFFVIL